MAKKNNKTKAPLKPKKKKEPIQKNVVEESPEEKRNRLISEIRPKLLTKSRLKMGGSDATRIHQHEMSAYTGVLNEINDLGKQLGKPSIGLGHLRKE